MPAAGDSPAEGPWLVVGLGNPGAKYANNRHNVGALVADELASRMSGSFRSHKRARALVLEGHLDGERLVVVKTTTYMNESGHAVASLGSFYKTRPARVLAVHDELDLAFGSLRLKFGGGDNGHNGLRSIRSALGTGDFHRLRFGIGRPPGRLDPAEFVLRDFSAAERSELNLELARAADALSTLMTGGLDRAQAQFNG